MKISKQNRLLLTYLSLGLLFVLAVFMRFYQLPSHLFFGFEQGRDASRIMDIIQGQDLFLVGPKTDLPGVFHGAWYYYLMIIPYFLGQGNPLFASFFLAILSASTVLIMFLLLKTITKKNWPGFLAALLTTFSFEQISYGRWLSNVGPAMPLVALAFLFLSLYLKRNQPKWIILSALVAGLAAQCEIILTLWFVFAFLLLMLFKIIKISNLKILSFSFLAAGWWYLPLLLFNLKNSWITVKSVRQYFFTDQTHAHSFALAHSFQKYGQIHWQIFKQTLVFVSQHWLLITAGLAWLLGLSLTIRIVKKKRLEFKFLQLNLVWLLMTLPALLFSDSVALYQLYLSTSLGFISLTAFMIAKLIKIKSGQLIVALLAAIWVLSLARIFHYLETNQGMFFITIQDDLNLKDQTQAIKYVLTDAKTQPYRFKAFAIPYYQEQGWQYLHSWLNPDHTDLEAQLIYLAIEPQVEEYWQQQWIKDLGPTKLVETQQFGQLIIQKRAIEPTSNDNT